MSSLFYDSSTYRFNCSCAFVQSLILTCILYLNDANADLKHIVSNYVFFENNSFSFGNLHMYYWAWCVGSNCNLGISIHIFVCKSDRSMEGKWSVLIEFSKYRHIFSADFQSESPGHSTTSNECCIRLDSQVLGMFCFKW